MLERQIASTGTEVNHISKVRARARPPTLPNFCTILIVALVHLFRTRYFQRKSQLSKLEMSRESQLNSLRQILQWITARALFKWEEAKITPRPPLELKFDLSLHFRLSFDEIRYDNP
jgi:hypothetical protein